MRSTIARLLLLTPVLALLTACPRQTLEPPQGRTVITKGPRDAYVTVVAKLDANGTPSFGDYHDTELVRPGDTLEFRCECDEGLEFQVRELRRVANKDAFLNHLLQANRKGAREQVVTELLTSFEKMIPDQPATQLFVDWEDSDFYPGDGAIGPFEVAEMEPGQDFAATWKFTWTIRAAGEQDRNKWEDLDPHVEWEPFHKTY